MRRYLGLRMRKGLSYRKILRCFREVTNRKEKIIRIIHQRTGRRNKKISVMINDENDCKQKDLNYLIFNEIKSKIINIFKMRMKIKMRIS